MLSYNSSTNKYVSSIQESKLSIYDPVQIGDPNLWIPAGELERLLNEKMRGVSLAGLPLRSRSKVVKQSICTALGYPVPVSFKKTQPRFPGQFFDVYVQKSNNLQVWNEELSASRRYVLVKVSDGDIISRVKVVSGDMLARLDTTGTLTQKYQARLKYADKVLELSSSCDTAPLRKYTKAGLKIASQLPTDPPKLGELFTISELFTRLQSLIGRRFPDAGYDQERNRGARLHQMVCKQLGYSDYRDDGRFPDVKHQLLELKLQTSETIDLGLVRPNSVEKLDIDRCDLRHCDVRYAIFCGKTDGKEVILTHFFLTTGEQFFARFPQFQGKVLNKKRQIPLPEGFFDI